MPKNLSIMCFFPDKTTYYSSFLDTTYTAFTIFSIFFKTSLATTKGPILLCFAKKIMTLSLAIYIRILELIVLLTTIPINEPIIKCKSRVDKWDAREPTTNLSILSDSIYISGLSSYRSYFMSKISGSNKSLAVF